ncbi:Glucanosyltransferase-domain-containing protein [Tricharina praecox]|uniref:Glucanosyltransferase-domain-containing protein n=1 Tax=Tricharina praecox TaxID=43433 RepID=UPI00221E97C8|nr:Glucanosyltransferase-domain-containing protein [Tricharina praecox]KAI5857255.1 Glucanosyltransferase-domain-containing protein [Tricharina praecox]
MRWVTLLAAAATLIGASSAAVETITMKDRHFYTSSGKPFFIRGVDYQPGGSADFEKGHDPLSDINTCARDIYMFQQLGINTIRVYSVDPSLDHDECMTLLAQAGIYLVLDVNSPLQNEHLNNQEPWTTYTPMYLEHIFSVIEVFSGYANTLAFLAGNEVVFEKVSAKTTPNYLKAIVRDMKGYIERHVSRVIPVGYSNADDLDFRISLAKYLECGSEGYIDFFGVNSYQWCGHNTFEGSGYDKLVEDYTDYSLPVFFTEFGCNESPPRQWEEVDALYSDKMTGVFSGGLVYEYTQEANNYGIVDVAKNGQVKSRTDFIALQKAYAKAPSDVKLPKGATAPKRPAKCPAEDDPIFENITANMTLPWTLGEDMIKNGVADLVQRGKFVTVSQRATEYGIIIGGKTISDKEVEITTKTSDQKALAAGGHGEKTGGWNGNTPADAAASADEAESAAAATPVRGAMFVGSLSAVALAFGLFL